uniref:Bactericidal permeability-increasing protein n=1 Tax=Chelonoidis abingdonii TaxID=106734 RepID=A0A8C0H156_CHEAB
VKTGKMLKFWYFFLLLHLLIQQLDANPGLKVRITQKGVRINTIEFPDVSISLIPGIGIKLSTQRAYATISMNWSIRTWLFKDSGSATVSISGVFITSVITMSQDSTGHPSMSLDSCQMSIRGVEVKLNGTIRYVARDFIYSSAGVLKLGVESCFVLSTTFTVPTQIDAFAQIDYSLVNSPGVFQSFIDLDLKGAIYPVGNWTDLAFVPAPFILPDKSDSMLYFGISEYFFKSASLAYYTSGAFNITMIEETLFLCLETLQIAKYYVEARPAMMHLRAAAPPVVSLQTDTFSLEICASMEVLAVLPDSTTQSIFTVNIVSTMDQRITFHLGVKISLFFHTARNQGI